MDAPTKYEATPSERFLYRWLFPGMFLVMSVTSWWWMLVASFVGALFDIAFQGGLGYVMWRAFRFTVSKRPLFAPPAPDAVGPPAERID